MSADTNQQVDRITPSVPVAPLRALIAQFREKALREVAHHRQDDRYRRIGKAVALAFDDCADDLQLLLDGLPHQEERTTKEDTRRHTHADSPDSRTAATDGD